MSNCTSFLVPEGPPPAGETAALLSPIAAAGALWLFVVCRKEKVRTVPKLGRVAWQLSASVASAGVGAFLYGGVVALACQGKTDSGWEGAAVAGWVAVSFLLHFILLPRFPTTVGIALVFLLPPALVAGAWWVSEEEDSTLPVWGSVPAAIFVSTMGLSSLAFMGKGKKRGRDFGWVWRRGGGAERGVERRAVAVRREGHDCVDPVCAKVFP